MARQLSALDMVQNEILNLRLQNLAAAPGTPVVGQVWFNTTSGRIEFRGTAANIDPTDRANHTGTQTAATISDFDTQVRTSRLDQMAAPTAAISANSQRITNLATPTTATDACTRGYADGLITALRLNNIAAAADVALGGFKITGLANGTAAGDAVNRSQLDTVSSGIVATRLDQFAAPTTAVSLNNQQLINLADATANGHAATWGQVQNLVNGNEWKVSVRAATTGNVALTGLQTIDGVTLAAGERVLVRANTAPAENGIWVVGTGAWTRAADAAQGTLTPNTAVFVEEGTTWADTAHHVSTNGPITVGTTAITWTQFGAGATYTADGTTINLVGNEFRAKTDTNGSLVRKFAQAVGDGTATSIAVTHNLGTTDVTIGVYEVATGDEIGCDKRRTSTSVVTLGFSTAPSAGAYRVVIHA